MNRLKKELKNLEMVLLFYKNNQHTKISKKDYSNL